ncbi:uncharacterized protein LOC128553810, partial [Mercenaria mercenaria]|uniref:uncharacterized protein LOC128553810 n=1 Tax=Mercenaria mercenaria TaxID=6596 RepID=UPI00234ECFA9
TKPVITFPRGHKEYAEVDCHKCEENRYNPYEGKRSDSFSVCERVRRDCRRTGFIECDKVAGIERQWTNSKCMCDVRKNFIPVREKESRCSDDDVLMCIERVPCPDTPDGKRQEYLLSNHSCSPVCGEGYYQRSAESDECIPKRILTEDSNTTLDVTTDPMDIKPVTVDPVSTTVKNITVITDVPSDGTNNDRGPPSKGV